MPPTQPIGFRSAPFLDLSSLTIMETACLLHYLRSAQVDIEEINAAVSVPLWREMVVLRYEVRDVFIRKFFEVP